MPKPRGFNGSGRTFQGVNRMPPRMQVGCPKCGAVPNSRCFRLRSWADVDGHPDRGFYTERQDRLHDERRASKADGAGAGPTREELRRRIASLARRKLAGSERVRETRWARSIDRTEGDLAARIEQLEAMSDLAW